MICPECGELTPPGPLDVRGCAPRACAREEMSPSILSALLLELRRVRNGFGGVAQSPRARRETFQPRVHESREEDACNGSRGL